MSAIFTQLGVIGLVGPDEPRYAWIARDMAETGDWITPRLYGQPWFEKPPLYYWGAAISFKLFGVSEAAARLPSAISALLATLALAWLAWRLYGAETARWMLLLLPTTVGMIGFSHAAATDMPFAAHANDRHGLRGRSRRSCSRSFAAKMGLSLLRRLPDHAVSSCRDRMTLALIFFGFFLGLRRSREGPRRASSSAAVRSFSGRSSPSVGATPSAFLHPAGHRRFCATALPWYILCARRNPDFFRVFIIEHNFKRFLTPEFQHIQPFWFYVPVLLLAFFHGPPGSYGRLSSELSALARRPI